VHCRELALLALLHLALQHLGIHHPVVARLHAAQLRHARAKCVVEGRVYVCVRCEHAGEAAVGCAHAGKLAATGEHTSTAAAGAHARVAAKSGPAPLLPPARTTLQSSTAFEVSSTGQPLSGLVCVMSLEMRSVAGVKGWLMICARVRVCVCERGEGGCVWLC
jgi:hypothetical protein